MSEANTVVMQEARIEELQLQVAKLQAEKEEMRKTIEAAEVEKDMKRVVDTIVEESAALSLPSRLFWKVSRWFRG